MQQAKQKICIKDIILLLLVMASVGLSIFVLYNTQQKQQDLDKKFEEFRVEIKRSSVLHSKQIKQLEKKTGLPGLSQKELDLINGR